MENLKLFIQLTRLNKPIGYMLLFWPCLWGLTIAYDFKGNLNLFIFYSILFFLGSVFMRSAGCIVNDIVDKNFDKKVNRTKNRPIASGKVSIKLAIIYCLVLCGLAFLVLINFNKLTIIIAILAMPLAFTYPLMKRFTYWPQLFLGLTFNWGIIMSWTSVTNSIGIEPIILYLAAIFWTLGYDTIYGLQDIHDDEIIGIKSTSIKFKNNVKVFVSACYGLFALLILTLCFMMEINNYLLTLSILFMFSLAYQIKIFTIKKPLSCLKAFKINNLTGIFILILLLSFLI